jgi:hypothetical protein
MEGRLECAKNGRDVERRIAFLTKSEFVSERASKNLMRRWQQNGGDQTL